MLINILLNTLMLLRIYNPEYIPVDAYKRMSYFELAGGRRNEYIDVIVDEKDISYVNSWGVYYRVLIEDLNEYDQRILEENEKLLKSGKVKGVDDHYLSLTEVYSFIENVALNYPNIVLVETLGYSYEGHPILSVKISDNPMLDEDEPEVLIVSMHHAREWPVVNIACFVIDTLTKSYGNDLTITQLINNREIYVIPVMNPDGYQYSLNYDEMWRKNRHYFPQWGSYGVDNNRNYAGACSGEAEGDWGACKNGCSHNPSSQIFGGPYSESEKENIAVAKCIRKHKPVIQLSLHTYSEVVIYPWGYTYSHVPDYPLIDSVAKGIATKISSMGGGGTYDWGQISIVLYKVAGDLESWSYGYGHYVSGSNQLTYTIEACTEFHPSPSYLPSVCRELFDGIYYAIDTAADVYNAITTRVLIDSICGPDYVPPNQPFTISWTLKDQRAFPDSFEILELTNPVVHNDDAEELNNLWELNGFVRSSGNSHSGNYSYKANNSNNSVFYMKTKYPYEVQPGDSFIFWVWYNIEENYDAAVAEISENGREWFVLANNENDYARFSGNSSGWIRKAYSLENWVGKSVYFRFRYNTDSYYLGSGFYVDDIYPVSEWNDTIIARGITSYSYTIPGKSGGEYVYRVRGYNSVTQDPDWGGWKKIVFTSHIADYRDVDNSFKINIRGEKLILKGKNKCITIFDITGKKICKFQLNGIKILKLKSSGIYFVKENKTNRVFKIWIVK